MRVLLIVVAIFSFAGIALAQDSGSPPAESPSANAPSPQPEARPPYNIVRQEEDWSFLRDAKQNHDFWDGVKYIPLGLPQSHHYLTLGGQERFFYEYIGNETWGLSPYKNNSYVLNRTMLSADLHVDAARLFLELKTGTIAGRKGGPRQGIDVDDADVNQGFLEVATRPLAPNAPPVLALRVGRQELQFGAGRQISVREGPNVRVGFDGVFGVYRPTGNRNLRVDAFVSRPAQTKPRSFDDGTDRNQSLSGVYATTGMGGARTLDAYYINKTRRNSIYVQGKGAENRHTVGFRLAEARSPKNKKAWDYDLEPSFQFGRFAESDIKAWSVSFAGGYTFRNNPQHLRLGLLSGFDSGDRDPNDRKLQTFEPPAPSGRYFGQIPSFGPQNVTGFAPTITLAPTKPVIVTLYSYFFWRQSVRDGIYALPGGVLKPGPMNQGARSNARYVGSQPEINVNWQMDSHLSLTVDYAQFIAGKYLKETPPGKDIRYLGAWLTYLF